MYKSKADFEGIAMEQTAALLTRPFFKIKYFYHHFTVLPPCDMTNVFGVLYKEKHWMASFVEK